MLSLNLIFEGLRNGGRGLIFPLIFHYGFSDPAMRHCPGLLRSPFRIALNTNDEHEPTLRQTPRNAVLWDGILLARHTTPIDRDEGAAKKQTGDPRKRLEESVTPRSFAVRGRSVD